MRWRKSDEWKKQRREKYATPEGRAARRIQTLRYKYGLTVAQFDAMNEAQNFKCAICEINPTKVVDHCHKTGRARQLLCVGCNLGLGGFCDNPEFVLKAAAYLRKHGD